MPVSDTMLLNTRFLDLDTLRFWTGCFFALEMVYALCTLSFIACLHALDSRSATGVTTQ